MDDAIYAGCRLVELLAKDVRPLSSHFVGLPKTYVTPEIRVDCHDDKKFKVVEQCRVHFSKEFMTVDIDGIRILFDDGWGLIRASNTQPALVLRFEANSQSRVAEMQEFVNGFLAKVIR